MRIKAILVAVLLVSVLAVSLSGFSPVSSNVVVNDVPAIGESEVLAVSNNKAQVPDASKVLETRFLNMLNHNFVYDEDFHTVEAIVNGSVTALLSLRDSEDEAYIAETYVSDYVFNMYGIEVEDYSQINAAFPKREGYVFILPRGYSIYKHEIISVTSNEDGSYSVQTKVTIDSHDSEGYANVCDTLFVPNSGSQFGYSIIYSNIGDQTVAM